MNWQILFLTFPSPRPGAGRAFIQRLLITCTLFQLQLFNVPSKILIIQICHLQRSLDLLDSCPTRRALLSLDCIISLSIFVPNISLSARIYYEWKKRVRYHYIHCMAIVRGPPDQNWTTMAIGHPKSFPSMPSFARHPSPVELKVSVTLNSHDSCETLPA